MVPLESQTSSWPLFTQDTHLGQTKFLLKKKFLEIHLRSLIKIKDSRDKLWLSQGIPVPRTPFGV